MIMLPEISRFYGIRIFMYYDEHNPPHFHAKYDGEEAEYNFDGDILRGSMPPRISKIIAGWAVLHSRELEENWDDARDGRELTSIRGLK